MEVCQVGPSLHSLRVCYFPRTMKLSSDRKASFLSISVANSKPQTSELESGAENRMFILGMGFVGQFFARSLKKDGCGTCTTVKKKKELEETGLDVCILDTNEPELSTLNAIGCFTHLLVSIPPVVGVGDPVFRHEQLLKSTLMDGKLQWLCYLSSTSVYGHCGGAWVDEDYKANPTSEVAKARLAAEEKWLNLGQELGVSAQVFRLGGIYGPGRSAIDTILKQEPLSRSQKARTSRQFTSRVHVEDICQALKCSFCKPSSRRIYNVVDDDPAPRTEVFAYAEELVERKWPGWVKQRASSERSIPFIEKGNSRAEKRVSNARMKRELGVRLLHPSYRSGLLSIIDQMEISPQNSF